MKKRNGSGLAESDFEKAVEFNGQLRIQWSVYGCVHKN